MDGLPDKIMLRVGSALDRQTETLRPLLLEREVREATAKAADEALARRVAQATIRATPLQRWSLILAAVVAAGGAFGLASKYIHIGPADSTTFSTSVSTTTVKPSLP